MDILSVIILAIVQGLTEFLPVSSSGHLVITRMVFGISDIRNTAFDAFLHMGTLVAVLIYYRTVWRDLISGAFSGDGAKREVLYRLIIATIPAAAVGYVFADSIENAFQTLNMVALGLLVTAAVLVLGDYAAKRMRHSASMTRVDALWVGVIQVLALMPGISRSGVTIAGGAWRGLSRKQAVDFSFLMSVPIIAGAGLSSMRDIVFSGEFLLFELFIGFAVSFVFGLVGIHVLLRIVQRVSFAPFAIYLVLLAGILFAVGL